MINYMFDVAFSIEGEWETPEEIPAEQLLYGMQHRLTALMLTHLNKEDDVTGAFGFCDAYDKETLQQKPDILIPPPSPEDRLCDAAPAMLEALEIVLGFIDERRWCGIDADYEFDIVSEAIAKARGVV